MVEETQKPKTYQIQRVDSFSRTNEGLGFATLSRDLSDDEFISYSSSDGHHVVIISKFASTQFKCSGSCFCSSERRRIPSSHLTLPLFLIFSAISSTLALKIAEKSFQDQCLLHFSSSCDEQNIHSSVSSCSEKEEEKEKITSTEKKYHADYFCEGHCINKKLNNPDALAAQKDFLETTGGCESLEISSVVRIERTINEMGTQTIRKLTGEVKYPHRYHHLNIKAVKKFTKDHLTPFCKDVSKLQYFWHSTTKKGYRQKKMAFMCVSNTHSNFLDERMDYPCQNIKCVMKRGRT